jgi:hypothetical protein
MTSKHCPKKYPDFIDKIFLINYQVFVTLQAGMLEPIDAANVAGIRVSADFYKIYFLINDLCFYPVKSYPKRNPVTTQNMSI